MATSPVSTPLGTDDARILALETGPIRGHTLTVLVLDDAPGDAVVHALRASVAQRLPEAKRWQQRLVSAPETPTGLAWQDDPDFQIEHHVRPVRSSGHNLQRIVSDIMMVPLDRSHPLWTIDIVPRLPNGQWAIVWKVHHCLADGMTKMRAGSRLLWTEQTSQSRESRTSHPPAPVAPAKIHAGERLAKVIGYRGLILREFRRVRDLSPLAADVGSDRAVSFARCTLAELRTIGKSIAPEVTINDVLLAVVAGALRRWMQGRGDAYARMKVQVPVSMHPHAGEDDAYGNRDSFLLVHLPLTEDDPAERVRAVSRAMRLRKNRHDARAIYALRKFLSHVPESMRRGLQRVAQGPQEYSLNVSNVPGPAGSIEVLGHHVDALYSIAEVAPHHALRIAAVSVSGSLFIGLCADPHVVPDLDSLADGFRLAIEELSARVKTAAVTVPGYPP